MDMDNPIKRKRGGQPKRPEDCKRRLFTFRTRDDLRAKIEAAAAETKRTMSEEVEFRLVMSFMHEGDTRDIRGQVKAALDEWLAERMKP